MRPRDLRQERLDAEPLVTQTELARELGMPRTVLSAVENERATKHLDPEFVERYRAGIRAVQARKSAAEVAS